MSLSKLQSLNVTEHLQAIQECLQNAARYLLDLSEEYVLPAAREHQTLVVVALLTLSSQAYYWHKFSFWSRRNVKGPRPIPVFGNLLDFIFNYRQYKELEWPKKYGKVYGIYIGTSPRLTIADANIVKKICVKDFTSFPNHHFFNVPNRYQRHFLIAQKDDHWRGMRAIMTPTFSSGRIKVMYKLLSDCADELCREHQRRIDCQEPIVDARQIYGSFSMSSALKSFYGLNLSLTPELISKQNGAQEEATEKQVAATGGEQLTAAAFARRSREAFRQDLFRFFVTNLFPSRLLSYLGYHSQSESRVKFFAQSVKKIIEQRQQSKTKFNDYLQLLVEAKANAEIRRTESEKHEDHHAIEIEHGIESWRPSKMTLSETEIHCQGMMLMMVATETTSTLIAHTVYLLAHHHDIQERLHQEVMKIATTEENNTNSGQPIRSFKYDDLIACEYLDCVISESLRLMSPVVAVDRVASEDYHIEEYNVTVPKGTILLMAYYAIHNDPDYWPEPTKFDPDRFNSENKHKITPGSYVPFGVGARACIGFRFALAEAKVGLAKLLCDFRFAKAPNTKYPAEPMKPVFIQNDHKDLRVTISKR